MKCPKCGLELSEGVMICPSCGAGAEDSFVKEAAETTAGSGSISGEGESFADSAADEGPVVSPISGGGYVPPEGPKKKKKWWILVLALLIIAAAAVFFGVRYYNEHYIVHEISLEQDMLEMIVEDQSQLTTVILPETAKDKSVTWESSDAGVASVDESGVVTAVGSGQCEITVTTNNGYTDSCEVHVKDLVDLQKEAADAVEGYISANAPVEENGVSYVKIRDIDDEHSFSIGAQDGNVVLRYTDAVAVDSVDVDVKYNTYVNLGYGNLETAEIIQDNQVEIYGYPVTATMKSQIALPEYQRGAVVPIESLESNLEGFDVNDKIQKMFNGGVKSCFEEFRSFLEYHPELNCSIETFGFTAVGDAPVEEEETVEMTDSFAESIVESMVESMPESMAEYSESGTTVVEEIAEPEMTDSTASDAEAAAGMPVVMPEEAASAVEAPEVESLEMSSAESALTVEEPAVMPEEEVNSVVEDLSDDWEVTSQAEEALSIVMASDAVEDMESAIAAVTEEAAASTAAIMEEAESRIEAIAEEAAVAAAAAEAADSMTEDMSDGGAAVESFAVTIESMAGETVSTAEEINREAQSAMEAVAEEAAAAVAAVTENAQSQIEAITEEAAATVVEEAMDASGSAMSDAESLASSIVEEIESIAEEAEQRFRAITESQSGSSSVPVIIPFATVVC